MYWAFQTGFVGSVMFGVWALVVVERADRWSVASSSLLLLASLMSSGIGLVFLAVVAVRTLLDPGLRARVLTTMAPTVLYAVWFSAFGQDSVQNDDIAGIRDLAQYVTHGIGHATGQITGLGFADGRAALLVIGALAFATSWSVIADRAHALAAGCLFGVVTLYTLVGLVRAGPENDMPERSRYAYVVSFLLIISIGDWAPEAWKRISHRPGLRAFGLGTFVVAVVSCVGSNAEALLATRAEFQHKADVARAYVSLALAYPGASWIDGDVSGVLPPIPTLLEAVPAHGSPLEDRLVPSVVTRPGSRAYEEALVSIVGRGFRLEAPVAPGHPASFTFLGAYELDAEEDGRCIRLFGAGEDAAATISIRGGARIRLFTKSSDIEGYVGLARKWPLTRYLDLDLVSGSSVDVTVPDVGDGSKWAVSLLLPKARGDVRACPIRVAPAKSPVGKA